jgi:hypothetical protein
MRRLVPLSLLAPLAALLAGCQDPARPTGVTPPAAALASTDPMSKVHPLPASLEQKVQRFRADLEANGYEVARGYWTLWGVEDCKYPLHTVGMCYGNNPTAPYVLAVVPPWKDEFVEQSYHHVLTEAQRGMSTSYRLGERDALVVLAELPPQGKYFGIQSNVFTRETAINTSDPIYQQLADPVMRGIIFRASPDPSRLMMIASIGNAINNVVIERGRGAIWSQQRYFVITPDAGTADAMTAALLRSGVPSADEVFTEPVAPALVRLGLNEGADDFVTYIRYTLPIDEAAGEAWRAQLPLTVLRVRPRSAAQPRPFSIPAYDPRSANYDETALAGDLEALVNAVRARWNQPAAPATPFFSLYESFDLVGQHCLSYPDPNRGPMNCLGDSQDAEYQIGPAVHFYDDSVVAVVGALSTETGNATYTSLSANWFPELVGVENLSDPDLLGTAAEFASALQHDSRLFYRYYVARDCTGLSPCLTVSKQQIPRGDILRLIERDYVNPGSAGGPDPAKLLKPVAIVLDGRHRPSALSTSRTPRGGRMR